MTLADAQSAARKAVQFDSNNQYKQALYYYNIAVKCLTRLQDPVYDQKILEYQDRITTIQHLITEEEQKSHKAQPVHQSELQRCKFLLNQAQDADEAGLKDIAVKLYTDAAEQGLKIKTTDAEFKEKLTALIRLALDRAESLKGLKPKESHDIIETLSKLPSVPETNLDVDVDDAPPKTTTTTTSSSAGQQARPPLHRGSSAHLKVSGGSANYTEEEKKVLLHSSHINDHEFVPFMHIDLGEKFQYAIPFTDKDGLLELAPKQKPDFGRWCRPEELFSEPKMLMNHHVDYYSIKQTVVSDCSFVASLAVSAQYEKRFGRRLITSIIYPQNRNKEPIYNPFAIKESCGFHYLRKLI
ncbi:calpain-7 isoform X2 [Calliopsis andreniformis]|uniref:calpain-7 isoform X2 n=1 Tax=Calliopsis andreniformis TaxID=337506 RepID=UPI003FCE6B13